MFSMSSLKLAPNNITKHLVEQDDDSVYTKRDCSLFIPKKWLNTRLASIEDRYFILAIFMIRIGDEYKVWNYAGTIELAVTEYQTTVIDGTECLEFKYKAGEIVVKNANSPVDNTLPYSITNMITKLGSIVPYLSYDDFLRIPETFPRYCKLNIPSYAYVNIYMAYVCRSKKDKRVRASLDKNDEYVNIPLSSVKLAVENTLNKFSGGYLDEATQAALMNPSDKASMSEIILRS